MFSHRYPILIVILQLHYNVLTLNTTLTVSILIMFPKYNFHVLFLINFSPVNERDLSQHLRYQLFLLLLGQIGLKGRINMNNKIFLYINIMFLVTYQF